MPNNIRRAISTLIFVILSVSLYLSLPLQNFGTFFNVSAGCTGNAICIPTFLYCTYPNGSSCKQGTPKCTCVEKCPEGHGGDWVPGTCGGKYCGAVCPSGYANCGAANSCACTTKEYGCGDNPCPKSKRLIYTCNYYTCEVDNKCTEPGCSTTAPTNLALTKIASSTWRLSWTPGSNGSSQRVYLDSDKANVESNCASVGCDIKDEAVATSTSTYSVAGLTEGVVYFARVVTYSSSSCSSNSTTLTDLSSCDMDSSSLAIQTGETATMTANVASSSELSSTTFSPSGAFISVSPGTDNSYIYSTVVTAVSEGTGTLTASVRNSGGTIICSSVSNVTVSPPGPWWQVKDGDVASLGGLTTGVTGSNLFDLAGDGGYPGVPSYSGLTDLDTDSVSDTGWLADSPYSPLKTYSSNYFFNQIPEDTAITTISDSTIDGSVLESGGTESYGYYWYQFDGSATGLDLTINADVNIGTRKVILLVKNADLNIGGKINLTDGQGFFMVVTSGNITVDATVGGGVTPTLEGMYAADGTFSSGAGSDQLWVRGSVAAQGGMQLLRDLGAVLNTTTPSELFEFAPDQILLYPAKLSARRISWKEVAP